MSARPSIDPEKLPRDYRSTVRIALVLIGILGPPTIYVYGIDQRLSTHLAELIGKRTAMDDYVREERAARCSIARNVYELCVATGTKCEMVEARCGK